MKKIFLVFFFLPLFTQSQNLIANGSFEDTVSCPINCGPIESALGWYRPIITTTDYIHSCSPNCNYDNIFGFQLPKTGVAYAGCILGGPNSTAREYMETAIDSALIAGECYHIEFYFSAGHQKYASDDIQVYFSDTLIAGTWGTLFNFNLIPQVINIPGNYPDTSNWTLVQGEYQANGGESYIIIGNFNDSTNTNLILIDPNASQNFSYSFIDDVNLTHIICTGLNEVSNLPVLITPNPAYETVHFEINSNETMELNIYDSASRICYSSQMRNKKSVDVTHLNSGVYFYKIFNNNNNSFGKIIIY